MSQKYRTTPLFNLYLEDLISNSPFLLVYISFKTGDENTKTDQLKDVISPNIKFSKPVLKEMYGSKKGELLIRSWS